jgi:hypothetical protein
MGSQDISLTSATQDGDSTGEGIGMRTGRDHIVVWIFGVIPIILVLTLALLGALRR